MFISKISSPMSTAMGKSRSALSLRVAEKIFDEGLSQGFNEQLLKGGQLRTFSLAAHGRSLDQLRMDGQIAA
jgi:hypothetical protein